jgi:hypothetical protein
VNTSKWAALTVEEAPMLIDLMDTISPAARSRAKRRPLMVSTFADDGPAIET